MYNNVNRNANEVLGLLSASIFQRFFVGGVMNLTQYMALVSLLARNGIPFDTEYTPSNGRDSTTLTVKVYLNPKVTVEFSFSEEDVTNIP